MSDRALDFVTAWIESNVHAEGYPAEGDNTEAKQLAAMCLAAAEVEGISKAEIDEAIVDLEDHMAQALDEVNDAEVERLAAKDD